MAQQATSDIAYAKENEIVAHYRSLAERDDLTPQEKAVAIKEICNHYERLLDDSKLLVSVGDRLQRKIKSANLMLREQADEIKRINNNLQEKNTELQVTIDELTRTRASRRASTIVLTIAIASFILSELIEQLVESYSSSLTYGSYLSWGIKIGLVFAIKPLENFFEKLFLQRAMKRKETEMAAAQQEEPQAIVPSPSLATGHAAPAVAPAQAPTPTV